MQPLIDGDVLRYEIGAVGDIPDEDGGQKSFDFVAEVLDGRIRDICQAVNASHKPVIFLTGHTNFRDAIATSRPYKGTRKSTKPSHFENITAYMYNQYEVRLQEGLEADDLMAIEQTNKPDEVVVCTRDKDLRQVPGWHYGWECGQQREFGPELVTRNGWLNLDTSKKQPKLKGVGDIFFYSQLITGDSVDNIPGLPGAGPVKAYDVLTDPNPWPLYERVLKLYLDDGYTLEYLTEQAQLLWMTRELTPEGHPVLWQPPGGSDE